MQNFTLHHTFIVTADVNRLVAFCRDVSGRRQIMPPGTELTTGTLETLTAKTEV